VIWSGHRGRGLATICNENRFYNRCACSDVEVAMRKRWTTAVKGLRRGNDAMRGEFFDHVTVR